MVERKKYGHDEIDTLTRNQYQYMCMDLLFDPPH